MTLCLRLSAPAVATASTRLARSSGRSTGTGSSHSSKQVEARTLMVSGRIALDTDYQCLETAKLTYRPITEVLVARSEEHTSELQSLMRISYAAFGLKKKI